jgi:NAD(P)-dependent dehydrogenase (short-subunit alcohol dehydrogenase family)/ferredoxin
LLYPKAYLIANALLDSDAIINCANCQPHSKLLLSGAVRNMFNAIVGEQQNLIYRLFPDPKQLARIVADVCLLVKPAVSILDMTTVRETGSATRTHPVGLILASEDPVALDAYAAGVIGYDRYPVWTSYYGDKFGLGCEKMDKISVAGIKKQDIGNIFIPPHAVGETRRDGWLERHIHFLQNTLLMPRAMIDEVVCRNCGDCQRICPVDAISASDRGCMKIDPARCVDCMLCLRVCEPNAVKLEYSGAAKAIQEAWKRAKSGYIFHVGPIAAWIRFSKRIKISNNQERKLRSSLKTISSSNVSDRMTYQNIQFSALVKPGAASVTGASEVALIVGVGPGLGSSLARRFAQVGMSVSLAARNAEKLDPLARELRNLGMTCQAYGCDAANENSVRELMRLVTQDMGTPSLVVFNVEHFVPGGILDIEAAAFEECWRTMCLGAFLVGRESAKLMVPRGSGTIIFSGATAAMRGKAGYINLAVGKSGVRILAQSMARELGAKGIHVAHVVLDGGILSGQSGENARERMSAMFPDEIAETYYQIHKQHKSAWTHELDLRPWVEQIYTG